jgi:hypothetical protein
LEDFSVKQLEAFAFVYIWLSIAAALIVLADIFLLGRRQSMGVMDAVWPLTLLYWGPLGLPFYFSFGRAGLLRPRCLPRPRRMGMNMGMGKQSRPCGRRFSQELPIAARAARWAILPPSGLRLLWASCCSARPWRRGSTGVAPL